MRESMADRNLAGRFQLGWFCLIGLTLAGLVMLSIMVSQTASAQQQSSPYRCRTDADGDGHISIECGGDDCDDHDPRRYPGNAEVADFVGHDEDCDPTTFSNSQMNDGDRDGDGEVDYRCFNRDASGRIYRGTDYDDSNPAIRKGTMICDGPEAVVLSGSFLPSIKCPTGTKCVMQPNGTGICSVPPNGYVTPPSFEMPTLPEGGSPEVRPAYRITPEVKAAEPAVNAAPKKMEAPQSAASADSEVKLCKSIVESGRISWGGGTIWAPANIDKLCNGTKDAKKTIECFQSLVAGLGWEKAIEKCK